MYEDLFRKVPYSKNIISSNGYLNNYFNEVPNIFKIINGDDRLILNNELSVAYLYGNIRIPVGGSPHLEGIFTMSARRENTGYLSLDSILNSKKQINQNLLETILGWLKQNNPLYKDFTPLKYENYKII